MTSADIRHVYTSTYYLTDCGDFTGFIRTGGALLNDERLLAINHVAALAPKGRALDLGCGRGELSIALARQGFTVTGIDYSPDAITIAQGACGGAGVPGVEFVCDDLNETAFEGSYTLAAAANVTQHLSAAEVDRLYGKVASHLAPAGLFVIQTSNPWHYLYDYPRRVRKALETGTALPPDPRSPFEKLIGIHEQAAGALRRQLRAHFPHVLVWFGGLEAGSRPRMAEMRTAPDVFAVASHTEIDALKVAESLRRIEVRKLGTGDLGVEVLDAPQTVARTAVFQVRARVENRFHVALETEAPYPLNLSYHWIDPESGAAVLFEGMRTALAPSVAAQSSEEYVMHVQAPLETGRLCLRVTLVQELVRWMEDPPVGAFADVTVEVA